MLRRTPYLKTLIPKAALHLKGKKDLWPTNYTQCRCFIQYVDNWSAAQLPTYVAIRISLRTSANLVCLYQEWYLSNEVRGLYAYLLALQAHSA
jgi:hypothetical protein